MKQHSYRLYTKVRVNENAKKHMPFDIGIEGMVTDYIYSGVCDYIVALKDGTKGKFREEELDVISKRKSWDQYFLEIAETVATRSTCIRLEVGCVIVKDKQIVSTGYNGSISGHEHCKDVGCFTNNERRCIKTIHAEQNALLFADRHSLKGSTAYVTHTPCETCSKLLAQAGIKKIVYRNEYFNKYNKQFLRDIEMVHIQEEGFNE